MGQRECEAAVNQRCSFSDHNNPCFDCKAVHESTVYIRELEDKLDKLRWIPVEERLPSEMVVANYGRSEKVEVTDGITTHYTIYFPRQERWGCDIEVTHWRNVILPKKGESE